LLSSGYNAGQSIRLPLLSILLLQNICDSAISTFSLSNDNSSAAHTYADRNTDRYSEPSVNEAEEKWKSNPIAALRVLETLGVWPHSIVFTSSVSGYATIIEEGTGTKDDIQIDFSKIKISPTKRDLSNSDIYSHNKSNSEKTEEVPDDVFDEIDCREVGLDILDPDIMSIHKLLLLEEEAKASGILQNVSAVMLHGKEADDESAEESESWQPIMYSLAKLLQSQSTNPLTTLQLAANCLYSHIRLCEHAMVFRTSSIGISMTESLTNNLGLDYSQFGNAGQNKFYLLITRIALKISADSLFQRLVGDSMIESLLSLVQDELR
jgi:hypothetical protein